MLTQIIWWCAVFLEFLLLLRGYQGKLVVRFPSFYSYALFVFAKSFLLFVLYRQGPRQYVLGYWFCQFIALVLGSLVLFEIYRVALRQYPGTARVARNLLLFVFALAFAKVLVNQSYGPLWGPAKTYEELERNLRVVQAFAVLAIVIVFVVYAIPRDRNLKGILAGYSLFVASRIVQLSLLTQLGSPFERVFLYLEPFGYLIVLGIWNFALWSPATEPAHSPSPLEIAAADHPALVSRTQQDLQNLQLGLPGAARR
jgi:hypothetical protein